MRRRTGRIAIVVMGLWTAASSMRARAEERPILVGPLARAELRKPPYGDWFEAQYSRYQPSAPILESLRPLLADVTIEAYFGTWCGDSRRQIPRLMRLLDLESFDEQRLSLVGLSDRAQEFKRSPGNLEAKREVHRTPTIVFLREGVEIGRIVETPASSLEADLLAILEGHGPEPKYGAEAWVHHLFTALPSAQAIKALQSGGAEVRKRGDPGSLWHYAEQDLLKNGRALEAKAVLDLYLELKPESAAGHVLLSEALIALGRRGEALAALERALAIEPGNDRARRAAAKLREP